jgi:hypothetical protein
VARAAAHVLATALCALRTARLPDPVRLGQIGLATVRLYEDAGLRLRAIEALPCLPHPYHVLGLTALVRLPMRALLRQTRPVRLAVRLVQ